MIGVYVHCCGVVKDMSDWNGLVQMAGIQDEMHFF